MKIEGSPQELADFIKNVTLANTKVTFGENQYNLLKEIANKELCSNLESVVGTIEEMIVQASSSVLHDTP